MFVEKYSTLYSYERNCADTAATVPAKNLAEMVSTCWLGLFDDACTTCTFPLNRLRK